jgi:predicted transcriptional regulator
MGRMAKDLTALRIDGELVAALKQIAAQPGGFYSERTVSWLINQAVKEFVAAHTPKPEQPPTSQLKT